MSVSVKLALQYQCSSQISIFSKKRTLFHVLKVNVWGPSDLKYLVDAMKSFIPNAAMVHTKSFGPAPISDAAAIPDLNQFADPIILVDDDVVKISAVLLWPEESGQNNGVYSAKRPGDMSVVYVCELPELKGRFHPERAKEKGLRPGPEYRELQLGKSVFSKRLNITVGFKRNERIAIAYPSSVIEVRDFFV